MWYGELEVRRLQVPSIAVVRAGWAQSLDESGTWYIGTWCSLDLKMWSPEYDSGCYVWLLYSTYVSMWLQNMAGRTQPCSQAAKLECWLSHSVAVRPCANDSTSLTSLPSSVGWGWWQCLSHRVAGALNELTFVKHLEPCWAHRKYAKNMFDIISYYNYSAASLWVPQGSLSFLTLHEKFCRIVHFLWGDSSSHQIL